MLAMSVAFGFTDSRFQTAEPLRNSITKQEGGLSPCESKANKAVFIHRHFRARDSLIQRQLHHSEEDRLGVRAAKRHRQEGLSWG